jgi:hypothetical protein
MPVIGVANRANIVIGQDGKVDGVVEGGDAVDPNGAIASCPLKKPKG